jgi:TRAP-type C4-dicarboxylate transport system permease large subunit
LTSSASFVSYRLYEVLKYIKDLYETLHKWLYKVPGGLGIANMVGCGIFAALCGSSPATAAAIGGIGIPEMRRRGYSPALATGLIAHAGTFGILIPPSVTMILYGVATETSISWDPLRRIGDTQRSSCILLLILGCFIPPAAVILMVAPLLLPIIQGLGFNPIWFAVIMTVNLEIGLVTPPVGLNLYVVKSIAPDIPMSQVLLGVTPFVIIDGLVIVILCIWPELALWLPNKMIG